MGGSSSRAPPPLDLPQQEAGAVAITLIAITIMIAIIMIITLIDIIVICSLCTCEVSCCLTDYGTSALAGKE